MYLRIPARAPLLPMARRNGRRDPHRHTLRPIIPWRSPPRGHDGGGVDLSIGLKVRRPDGDELLRHPDLQSSVETNCDLLAATRNTDTADRKLRGSNVPTVTWTSSYNSGIQSASANPCPSPQSLSPIQLDLPTKTSAMMMYEHAPMNTSTA